MKWIIKIAVPFVILGLCVWGEVSLANFLFSKLPQDLSWLFWAKVGIGVGLIWLTSGIVVSLTVISGMIANALTK